MSRGRDVFDLRAIGDELLFCHNVFKFTSLKPSKSPVLGDVDRLAARELELGPKEGLSHMFLFGSLVQMDITTCPVWTLATVSWGFLPHLPV